jgi:glyoxylase-like metal-dependent hydrolase (beta-lactamase superfamily II)
VLLAIAIPILLAGAGLPPAAARPIGDSGAARSEGAGVAVPAREEGGDSLRLEKVAEGVYAILAPGFGPNSGFILDGAGVTVIDAGATEEDAKARLALIRSVTPLPIRHLVLTHSHLEHAGGTAVFRREGAVVVAQYRTRDQLRSTGVEPGPGLSITRDVDLVQEGRTAQVLCPGDGHTKGNVVVFEPASRVLFAGGFITNGSWPSFRDADSYAWTRSLLELPFRADRIVPGEGPVGDALLRDRMAQFLRDLRGEVTAALSKGLAPVEAKAAVRLAAYEHWARPEERAGAIERVIAEMSPK